MILKVLVHIIVNFVVFAIHVVFSRPSLKPLLETLCKKASSAIGALKRVPPFIPTDVAVQIYNVLILPHFDYCSPVWDCMSGYLSDKLQKLQNRAARVITQSPFETSSNLLLAMLKWEKLSLRRKKTESFNYV